ncbi:EndoU domain-containing protein [Paraburkholderia sp. J67]|uniref:EndoU domain-containing protein n=1 Tax=Paraburkholderia sp. J67 TaxID=2805435 RepID=UPI002ABE999C|nr:EndoU domain-containing protein [Paraburkholderia sp. J67]
MPEHSSRMYLPAVQAAEPHTHARSMASERHQGLVQLAADIAASPRAVAQRAQLAQLKGQGVVQRVSDEDVKSEAQKCEDATRKYIPLYSRNWKSKNNATRLRIFATVHEKEPVWDGMRDHVMQGEYNGHPAGYHSKFLGGASKTEATGVKQPAGVGGTRPYKQWIKKRGQVANNNLKISTFFPDNWSEDKIRACVLLSSLGEDHQLIDQLQLVESGDATVYPATKHRDPQKPQ